MIKFVLEIQIERCCSDAECLHDVIWDGVEQRYHISRDEQLLAENIQALYLAAPAFGLFCFAAHASGELTGDQRSGQKCHQRNPILRIGNREGAHWWQEEEIEGEHGYNRCEYSDGQTPDRRYHQDRQQ